MKFNFGFFVSVLACGVILNALPVDDLKFALHKLSPLIQSDMRLRELVAENCGSLESSSATPLEKHILERLPVPSRELETGAECVLVAQHAKATRLRLRSYYDFHLQIRGFDSQPIADTHFAVDFPRPLVLLPLLVFLLALVFEFRRWGIAATIGSYIFMLCGANLILLLESVGRAVKTSLTGEQSWLGLYLILFWAALCRGRTRRPKSPPLGTPTSEGRWINRAVLGTIGLWNPAAFTVSGALLAPFRGAVTRLSPFFTAQVAAIAMSLYLLSLSQADWKASVVESLSLPRYFTFGTLLFMLLEHESPKREPISWRLPAFWRTLLFVTVSEAAAFHFPAWDTVPTLTRIGIALVSSQLIWPLHMNWKRVSLDTFKWGSALLTAAVISVLSHQLSVTDLALLLFDPRIHPTGVVFFTFLSGLCLGFITGNFAVAFFPLFMTLMKAASVPLVKAALLDGILAGILLSPFSIHNLLPAAQFSLKMPRLIAYRFQQLAFPLLIGLLIYAVSAINSVAILRPATFIFLCLVAVVFQLKKAAWRLQNYTISPDLRSDAR